MHRIYYFILFVLIGCKAKDGAVGISIANEQVYFSEAGKTNQFYSYINSDARAESQNIITYTITNNSKKKILFVINEELLVPAISIERSALAYTGFFIKNINNDVLKFSNPLVTFDEEDSSLLECYIYNDSIKKDYYTSLGIDRKNIEYVDNYLKNSIVLYPGDKHVFKTIISFPIIKEIQATTGAIPLFYSDLDSNCRFQIFYKCDGKKLKQALPQYILDNLQDNQIEIFDGDLISNEIIMTPK